MPSLAHAALVEIFRSQPELVPRLLRQLGVKVPPHERVTVCEGTLDELAPKEYRADLLIDIGERTELAVVLEVQLRVDGEKLFSWPSYAIGRRARLRCRACVLVITPSAEVAAWASQPIDIGPGNENFRVTVLGPEELPVVTDPVLAAGCPLLGVLSLMAHGDRCGEAALLATLDGLQAVDNQDREVYVHLIFKALGEPMRRTTSADAAGRPRCRSANSSPTCPCRPCSRPCSTRPRGSGSGGH